MTSHEQAFKEAEQEITKEKVEEIKGWMKSILQKIEDQKKIKSDAEEAVRVLKLELDDLRAGRLDKIKERHESKRVRNISPLAVFELSSFNVPFASNFSWPNATSGYYIVKTSNGIKEIYF